MGVKEWEKHAERGGVEAASLKRNDQGPRNEPIIEVEANEFLKFIKHNEYNIVEQLHKLLAKISILALLLNLEPHREAMLKVLKQAYVPHNASIDKIDRLVRNIIMDNYISFNDGEIPSNGCESVKALHITTKVKHCTLHKVLIDNCFSLNDIPMSTLLRLPIDVSYMKHSKIVVRAFDGTRREVTKEIGDRSSVWPLHIQYRVPSYGHLVVL